MMGAGPASHSPGHCQPGPGPAACPPSCTCWEAGCRDQHHLGVLGRWQPQASVGQCNTTTEGCQRCCIGQHVGHWGCRRSNLGSFNEHAWRRLELGMAGCVDRRSNASQTPCNSAVAAGVTKRSFIKGIWQYSIACVLIPGLC